jgi:hypothetical protein
MGDRVVYSTEPAGDARAAPAGGQSEVQQAPWWSHKYRGSFGEDRAKLRDYDLPDAVHYLHQREWEEQNFPLHDEPARPVGRRRQRRRRRRKR